LIQTHTSTNPSSSSSSVIHIARQIRLLQETNKILIILMEGLIPLVYKAIKRNKTGRQYKSLSNPDYNIADFYSADSITHQLPYLTAQPERSTVVVAADTNREGGSLHRRYKSVDQFSGSRSVRDGGNGSNQVVEMRRYRSHRGFLSCISCG
ncbi:hypothetical protein MKX03_013381, partial [Papaver bracteatum]